MKFSTTILLCSSLLLATACGDDGGDGGVLPDAAPLVDADPNATYRYSVDIQPIWDANCIACHGFLTGDSYDNVVNTVSGAFDMNRVTPGDTANSYIWHKINDTHTGLGGAGSIMPPAPAAPLTVEQIGMIETWILENAPR